jgi:hypothetical protein
VAQAVDADIVVAGLLADAGPRLLQIDEAGPLLRPMMSLLPHTRGSVIFPVRRHGVQAGSTH